MDGDVILVGNLCTELGADTVAGQLDCSWKLVDTVAMSIGRSGEACADTDIMSFGAWATNGNPNLEIE